MAASCPATLLRVPTAVAWREETGHVMRGISVALVTLIDVHADAGYARSLFDELARQPLCDPALQIPSFCLTESYPNESPLCISAIQTFLEQLITRLRVRCQELVLAYIIIECVFRVDSRILQKRTARLLFVAATSIVMKLTIDCEWTTRATFALIDEMVVGCDATEFAQMESAMLARLNYTLPVAGPSIGELCIVYTVALMNAGGAVMSRDEAKVLLVEEEATAATATAAVDY